MQCDLMYGFLKCALPEDTIDVDLKVCMLKGIYTFKKDYKSQTSKSSLCRAEVQPYPTLRKRMVEFMCRRQITTTSYASKSYKSQDLPSQTKSNPREEKLVQLTKPDRGKLVKLRKIKMQKFPSSTVSQLNWKSATGRSLS